MNARHQLQTEPLEIPPQGFIIDEEMRFIDAAIENSRRLEKKWGLVKMDSKSIAAAIRRFEKTGTFKAEIIDI